MKCTSCGKELIRTGIFLDGGLQNDIVKESIDITNCEAVLRPNILGSVQKSGVELYSFVRYTLNELSSSSSRFSVKLREAGKLYGLDRVSSLDVNGEFLIHPQYDINGVKSDCCLDKVDFFKVRKFIADINICKYLSKQFHDYAKFFDEKDFRFIVLAVIRQLEESNYTLLQLNKEIKTKYNLTTYYINYDEDNGDMYLINNGE